MEELKELHEQITDLWKVIKAHYPVMANTNEQYWDDVCRSLEQYERKYPKGTLGFHLALGYLGYLKEANKED